MRSWPALDVDPGADPDLVVALVDDQAPTAVESLDAAIRLFFPSSAQRDAAQQTLASAGYRTAPIDVPDEDWARRSQASLTPVTVGRVTIAPPWAAVAQSAIPSGLSPQPSAITVIIQPSLGFGTGHHPTTRLCLRALQQIDLAGGSVLDVGTGSGVLAITASLLGARCAVGIDLDEDALRAARENLALNPAARRVDFLRADIERDHVEGADVVVANLSAAVIERAASSLVRVTTPDGVLIVSGLMVDERDAVVEAVADLRVIGAVEEDGWVAIVCRAGSRAIPR